MRRDGRDASGHPTRPPRRFLGFNGTPARGPERHWRIVGHGAASTTLNIYAHVPAEQMEQFVCPYAKILGTHGG